MKASSDLTLIDNLCELVAAIDRRMPHLARDGEGAIARDAQRLKRVALKRIAELERSRPAQQITTDGEETA